MKKILTEMFILLFAGLVLLLLYLDGQAWSLWLIVTMTPGSCKLKCYCGC